MLVHVVFAKHIVSPVSQMISAASEIYIICRFWTILRVVDSRPFSHITAASLQKVELASLRQFFRTMSSMHSHIYILRNSHRRHASLMLVQWEGLSIVNSLV